MHGSMKRFTEPVALSSVVPAGPSVLALAGLPVGVSRNAFDLVALRARCRSDPTKPTEQAQAVTGQRPDRVKKGAAAGSGGVPKADWDFHPNILGLIWDSRFHRENKNPRFTGVLGADEGTRTLDLLHGKDGAQVGAASRMHLTKQGIASPLPAALHSGPPVRPERAARKAWLSQGHRPSW
jgi:hypothetical protein